MIKITGIGFTVKLVVNDALLKTPVMGTVVTCDLNTCIYIYIYIYIYIFIYVCVCVCVGVCVCVCVYVCVCVCVGR